MSKKQNMNTFRKYISQVVGDEEEEMEVDNDFTRRYLSQFATIDEQTIDVMVDNGYENKDSLLAFDLKEDLPLLPVLTMGQKSLLRKVLIQLHENEEFESKVNDIKGVDEEPSFSTSGATSALQKRKRESMTRSPNTKRSKTHELVTDLDSTYTSPTAYGDGLGTRMRQLISGRKSIRNQSDFESDLETELIPKRYSLANNRVGTRMSRTNTSTINTDIDSYDDEEEEVEEEVPQKQLRGRPRTSTVKPTPVVIASKATRNSLSNNRSVDNIRTTRTPNSRLSTTLSIGIKSETNTPSKPSRPYVPTPTELEVRERLAQKKALGKQKNTRNKRN